MVAEDQGHRSVIDLTPLHPETIGRACQEAEADHRELEFERRLELAIGRFHREEPLLQTRVVGEAPAEWLYDGRPCTPDDLEHAYLRLRPAGRQTQ